MRYIIKEPKYIRKDVVVANYIKNYANNLNVATKVLQGLENANQITDKDVFEHIDVFKYGERIYAVLENKKGIFIVRSDNLQSYFENNKEKLRIAYLLTNGDKTFLIDKAGNKYTTTRHKEDKEDIEKAIMLLLLKREGYTYKDITDLVAEIDYNETDKKSTKSNKKEK